MEHVEALLESWDRQCRIVDAVASLVDDANRHVKPSDDGMPLDSQLAHMHGVRRYFLSQVAPVHAENLVSAYADKDGTPLADLGAIKACLNSSAQAVRSAVQAGLERGGPMAGGHVVYDNAVLFLQHMVWHDGWHVGLIFLALRLNGQEPPEEWEEPNVWGQWRTETW
ncbi:MAG: DinB family protein [Fimbriimonas sp.]|nr:DinB family protein [Fimbriimonas sp.]